MDSDTSYTSLNFHSTQECFLGLFLHFYIIVAVKLFGAIACPDAQGQCGEPRVGKRRLSDKITNMVEQPSYRWTTGGSKTSIVTGLIASVGKSAFVGRGPAKQPRSKLCRNPARDAS